MGCQYLASAEKKIMLQQKEETPHALAHIKGPKPAADLCPGTVRVSCWLWL